MNKHSIPSSFFIRTLFLVLFGFSSSFGLTQYYYKIKPYTLMVNLSYNVVIDDSYLFGFIPDVINHWSSPPVPVSLGFDYYFLKGISAEYMMSYNHYHWNPDNPNPFGRSGYFLSIKLNGKYSFAYLLENQSVDPFVYGGIYYAGKSATERLNTFGLVGGVGVNLMMFGNLGLQVRADLNKALLPDFLKTNDNFYHIHAGFVFKFQEGEEDNPFLKKRYKWTNKKVRFKNKRGL